ncbi:MAG: hypothetical protein WC806_06005, partial [Candidatus Gracilibacteria bacterium]
VDDKSPIIKIIFSVVYAGLSAGLIISVILVFVSGVSFIGGGNEDTTTTALWGLSNQSQLIKMMISNTYLWFALPALAFLVHSLYTPKD